MKKTMENSIVYDVLHFASFSNFQNSVKDNEGFNCSQTKKNKKKSSVLNFLNFALLLIIFNSQSFSQVQPNQQSTRCRTSEKMLEFYQLHPEALIEKNTLELSTQTLVNQKADHSHGQGIEKAASTYTIPVVFHVYGSTQNGFTITLAKIQAALVELNKDFNGLNSDYNSVHTTFMSRRGTISINFALALIDPNGNVTTGVEFLPVKAGYGNGGGYDSQIAADAWDNYKYMNVYIQGDIYNDGGTSNSGVAWYPSTTMSNAKTARVVYNGSYLGFNTDAEFASVLTHEFGHFMNLAHTFDLGCSSLTNDNVADTPPCDENYDATDICHPSSSANSPLNCSNNLINAENYMDYRGRSWKGWVNPDYGCYKMFTQGQITRIEAALQDPARITLWQTSNLIATGLLSNVLTASVVISANSTTICTGTNVTFTATPTNGGSTPTYQWKVGGVNVGTNSSTFSSTTLTNGQIVTCVMTSNLPGVTSSPATSNAITMVVTSSVAPTISIAVTSGSNPSCLNSSITFTATAQNGGTSPIYQWKVNGVAVGSNQNTFSSSTLASGSVITCELTSNSSCASPLFAVSPSITLVVNTSQSPSVTIGLTSGTNPSCMGASLVFTAVATNGGTVPAYQWKVNGVNVGTNSSTFTSSTITNGQVVTCDLTSGLACASPQNAVSSGITMVVNSSVTPSISIVQSAGPNPMCAGATATFTATIQNGSSSPVYQWKVNGVNVGTNSNSFTTATLTNGQTVSCVLTSNAVCASSTTATSNMLSIVVNAIPVASLTISQTGGSNPTCAGSSVSFTATPNNGGSSPTYQWKVDGVNVGTSFSTYSTTSLTNNQVVTCEMVSNLVCASTVPSVSNGITMILTTSISPSISIVQNVGSNPSCMSSNVGFTATIQNGGTSPSYQWKVDGVNSGINSPNFTSTSLTNGQVVTCQLTSNGSCVSPLVILSNGINMQIESPVAPTVSILLTSGSNPTCSGSSLTFTASSVNGGTSPSYQWQVNGSNVGSNLSTFTTSAITANQTVTCVLTSNYGCLTSTTATSNGILMTITSISPTVSISQTSGSNPMCLGSSAAFTVSSTNGGSAPTYQWQINGLNVGANSTTFSTTSLTNNQVVTCVLTSNLACVSPQTLASNGITMNVSTPNTPTVSIVQSTGSNSICAGSPVSFSASNTNGGTTPNYQWKVDGVNSGTNSSIFTISTLTNGQVVTCLLTSNAACTSPLTATSNGISITVSPNVVPTNSILQTVGTNPSCAGQLSTFIATSTNGGLTPSYQWKIDGINVGTNSPTFSTSSLTNGQILTCVLTSNATCASPLIANSQNMSMQITTTQAPIANSTQSFCNASTLANLQATGTNLKWYSTLTGGSVLSSSTTLVNGTTYYVSQTVAGCESVNRVGVTVSIVPTPSPTGQAVQSFCNSGNISNLSATGNSIKWYSAASNGTLLSNSTALTNGSIYYATQTISGCESSVPLAVTVSISNTAAPSGSSTQSFCNSGMISDIAVTGNSINWYTTSTGGSALLNSVSLGNGTTYYASQTILGCVSVTRLAVQVTIVSTSAPTGVSSQTYCPNSTVASLQASGNLIKWFATSTGGTQLLNSTNLVNGTTYYASQTMNGCESSSRFAATVVIGSTSSAPTGNQTQSFCGSATISNLVASGNAINWYYFPTGGTPISNAQALSNGYNYYASQTINGCESLNRLLVAVTINSAPVATISPIPMVCQNDPAFTLTQGSPAGGVYSGSGINNGIFTPSSAPVGIVVVSYTYTNLYLCSSTVQTSIVIDDCISLEEVTDTEFLIYPNPVKDVLNINLKGQFVKSMSVFDQFGRIVYVKDDLFDAEKEELNLQDLSSGTYFIQIETDNEILNKKFFILE